jgi:hypothetical protein
MTYLLLLILPLQSLPVVAATASTDTADLIAEVQRRYPDARFLTVRAEDLPQLERASAQLREMSPSTQVYIVRNEDDLNAVTATTPAPATVTGNGAIRPDCTSRESPATAPGDVVVEPPAPRVRVEGAHDTPIDLTLSLARSITPHRGRDEAAVVMFIVIGVVVVVALVAYSAKYFYDAYSGFDECPKWWDLTLQSAGFNDGDANGYLTALRVSTGIQDQMTRIGLTAELGRLYLSGDNGNGAAEVSSNYWMLGPAIRWYLWPTGDPAYVSMEVLAGLGSHRDLGNVSVARAGINLPVGSPLRIGFSFGALYTALERSRGYLSTDSNYHYLFGIEMGTRF